MKIKSRLAAAVSVVALVSAGTAYGQDFYAGLGVEVGRHGPDNQPDVDSLGYNTVSGILGVRFDVGSSMFVGAEGEFSFGANGSHLIMDDLDRISRLRLMAGTDVGNLTVFGAIGKVRVENDGPGSFGAAPFTGDGVTWGAGVEMPVTGNVDLRMEAIFDKVDPMAGYTTDWKSQSLRAAAIIKF